MESIVSAKLAEWREGILAGDIVGKGEKEKVFSNTRLTLPSSDPQTADIGNPGKTGCDAAAALSAAVLIPSITRTLVIPQLACVGKTNLRRTTKPFENKLRRTNQ
jgi:hypothetical protein